MSSTDEAVNTAQSRAQEALDDNHSDKAEGDLTASTQKVSNEHASKHGDASGMTQASDEHHDASSAAEDKGSQAKKDQIQGLQQFDMKNQYF
ncbi:hypothetical protein LTR05_001546 [Lithohypha guttulata]|uniref:Uncharacterized protein n=1 Tax=Lithohypha guttulata TaxID=1690604 RepID=A0AAN7T6I8_9EURO|nr:hypothetical protein LTR05_001546 [Lithohypha guttulata]